jgi:hypothetical protein
MRTTCRIGLDEYDGNFRPGCFFPPGGIHALSAFDIIPIPASLFPAAACEVAGLFYKIHQWFPRFVFGSGPVMREELIQPE